MSDPHNTRAPVPQECLPWEPIPQNAIRWFRMGVVSLTEVLVNGTGGLEVLVSAAVPGSGTPEHWQRWLITFDLILAYFMHEVPVWVGADVWPRPADQMCAMWEVAPSAWLQTWVDPDRRFREGESMHHYVILSEYDAYEFIARSWTAKPVARLHGQTES